MQFCEIKLSLRSVNLCFIVVDYFSGICGYSGLEVLAEFDVGKPKIISSQIIFKSQIVSHLVVLEFEDILEVIAGNLQESFSVRMIIFDL